MGLLAINSHANVSNTGSNRALLSVGYVQTGVYYCSRTVHGQAQDVNDYLLPNPVTPFWNLFWNRPKSAIPPEFHEARKVTRAALTRAHQYVTFL